jgi:hypothetical protein
MTLAADVVVIPSFGNCSKKFKKILKKVLTKQIKCDII